MSSGISIFVNRNWRVIMKKFWFFAIAPGIAALVIFIFLVMLFVVKILWAWTIPDLFPGAVEQGLVAKSISWFTAFKLAIFVAIMGGVAGISRKR